MTGNAFLKRLKFQLDFLAPEDQGTVLSFYEKKLAEASTLMEEEEIVKGFGSPEHISAKLREAFLKQSQASDIASDEEASAIEDALPQTEEPSDLAEDLAVTEALTPSSESAAEGDEAAVPEVKEKAEKAEEPSAENAVVEGDLSPVQAEENMQEAAETVEEKETPVPSASSAEPDKAEASSQSEQENAPSETETVCADATEAVSEQEAPQVEAQGEQDVIFSKPATEEKAPEIIHSLENKEIQPLFGEKVVVEGREAPTEVYSLEPMDVANGLTEQEIEQAKAETLEKASRFQTTENEEDPSAEEAEDVAVASASSGTPSGEPAAEEESDPSETDPEEEKRVFPGLFKKMFANSKMSNGLKGFLIVFLSILCSPLLLVAVAASMFLYVVLLSVTAAVSVCLFVLMALLIVFGVIELVFGICMLFSSVPVALIEIGVGTVLFSIVVAIAALIYEFLFALVPKMIKLFTRCFVRITKLLWCYLYGGKV